MSKTEIDRLTKKREEIGRSLARVERDIADLRRSVERLDREERVNLGGLERQHLRALNAGQFDQARGIEEKTDAARASYARKRGDLTRAVTRLRQRHDALSAEDYDNGSRLDRLRRDSGRY